MAKDYAAIATQYAEDVCSGKQIACKWVRLACQRQLNDIGRSWSSYRERDFPYEWNPELYDEEAEVWYKPADRACAFLETLPHIKGPIAGDELELSPWQVFTVAVVMGWIRPGGYRRFKYAYEEVARKNGKTFKLAGLGIYFLAFDGEAGAEVYAVATKSAQAQLLWKPAKSIIDHRYCGELRSHFGLKTYRSAITQEATSSTFQYLGRDSKTEDGLSVSAGLVDELHAHRDRGMFDIIDTATGARAQPIIWIITTAGSDQSGVCYEQREHVKKILEGTLPEADEQTFGIIYTIDDEDMPTVWENPDAWRKANPNFGVSFFEYDFLSKLKRAKVTPAAQNNFLTKHLNVWCNADSAWMDMLKWNERHNAGLRLEDLKGEKAILAADLASKIDIAALCLLFDIDGVLRPFLKYYLPDERLRTTTNQAYSGWHSSGLLTMTPGQIIDFDYIEADCEKFSKWFDMDVFAYDPFQATQFAGRMINEGWNMVEVRPSVLNFSEPMKELEARIISGTFEHNDPILTWMISNVVCHYDAKDNIYPRKANEGNPHCKIDGVVALLMALNRYMNPSEDNIYDKRGLRVV